MTRILLLGCNGQVGWELQRSLAPLGAVVALDFPAIKLEQFETLRAVVRKNAPHLIVNAAAYTAVDKAESEPDAAATVNSQAVGVLAEEAKKLGALLVHYSTDYVFDGSKPGSYTEDDAPNPISVYGRTKLEGDRAIHASGCKHLIFRTSWVYAARGGNFARTILRLAGERDELKIVADQIGAPTSAELIADVTALCVGLATHCPERFAAADGIYNLVASGETSWHNYAQFVVANAARLGLPLKLASGSIRPIATSEYPLPAARPLNSRLATGKLNRVFGIELPHWQIHLERVIAELVASQKA
ncbi:MAG: dTDP-4-dehydrorhamnose reductase [Betaproteobacteria bacterium]|nr:dTDP-4-dehydrorhamnose reductase [Betaproteobacteria bacterium]